MPRECLEAGCALDGRTAATDTLWAMLRFRSGAGVMPNVRGENLCGRCPDCEPITRAALLGACCAQFNCERDLRMKIDWKKLIVCLAVPLAVGGLAALLTRGSMETFEAVAKPPLAPPGWLFPVVWTVLYVLMGTASYLVLTSGRPNGLALLLYGAQLLFNFFWPLFFFNMQAYLFAFVWLVLLWLLILAATILFFRISRPAGWLMVPYLLWVAFAGYLNLSIYLLN